MNEPYVEHEPVLVEPVLSLLQVQPGETVLDVTLGHGGHALLLARAAGAAGRLIGLDVDLGNIERARHRLESGGIMAAGTRVDLVRANFSEAAGVLDGLGIEQVDVILADLGVSTDQLMDPARGLTFAEDGPLDMRLDDRLETTAADLVNGLPENELADLIYQNAQEHFSRRIARRICEVRRNHRIRRTSELAGIVASAVGRGGRAGRERIHPATRTFLALRMAVNQELENLQSLLSFAPARLRPGGRVGIISFHSGEDRLVKRDFLDRKGEGVYEIRTKKPVVPSSEEVKRNPRSRSAKLRVAVRLGVEDGAEKNPSDH